LHYFCAAQQKLQYDNYSSTGRTNFTSSNASFTSTDADEIFRHFFGNKDPFEAFFGETDPFEAFFKDSGTHEVFSGTVLERY